MTQQINDKNQASSATTSQQVQVEGGVRRARWMWLMQETKDRRGVDVLNSDFVDAYINQFGLAHRVTCWGANICRQLGRDLADMAKMGYLERARIGLGCNWQPGFPKWVWSYSPGKYAHMLNA